MSKRKNFNAPPSKLVTISSAEENDSAVVHIGKSIVYRGEYVDLSFWLDKGIDEWVWSGTTLLRAFIASEIHTQATVAHMGKQILPAFYDFMLSQKTRFSPKSITLNDVDDFIRWLKNKNDWGMKTKRNTYLMVKSILRSMHRRQVTSLNPREMPVNVFKFKGYKSEPTKALSDDERIRLAECLRKDIIDIHHNKFSEDDSSVLVVYILAIALRTGLNVTPLLELERDALHPHPFMPNMRVLRSFKRRGRKTNLSSIKSVQPNSTTTSIPMDGVALLEKIIRQTEPITKYAEEKYKNFVWLYRERNSQGEYTESVVPLTAYTINKIILRFVKRHNLRDDNNDLLILNISRLRKTLENRLWILTNGDVFTVSLLMGHDPKVADKNYLQISDKMKQDGTVVSEDLPSMFRGEIITKPMSASTITPVGGCLDSLDGEMAPKDGINHCGDFLSCFSCRSFAINGSHDDLHRLFSFYWHLDSELIHTNSASWRDQFSRTMMQIDDFTLKNFSSDIVFKAKNSAKENPNLFWKNLNTRGKIN